MKKQIHDLFVLVVEDEEGISTLISELLGDLNVQIETAATGRDAMNIMLNKRPDLVLLDFYLPDITADQFVKNAERNLEQGMPAFILTTGAGDSASTTEMEELGARTHIIKDVNFFEELIKIVTEYIDSIQDPAPASAIT